MTFVDSTGKDLTRGATGKRAWVSGGRKARLLQEFAVSGLCAARFAKLAGVKPVTFYAWLRKQKAASTQVPGNQHQRPVPLVEAVFDLPSNLHEGASVCPQHSQGKGEVLVTGGCALL